MKINLFFSINCRFWKHCSDLNDVKHPFLSIYDRFNKMYEASSFINDLIHNTVDNSNNNSLFYTGSEKEVKQIGERWSKCITDFLTQSILGYSYNKKEIFVTSKVVKIKMNDRNSSKGKRLLSILIMLTVDTVPKRYIWTLFPLEYANFH